MASSCQACRLSALKHFIGNLTLAGAFGRNAVRTGYVYRTGAMYFTFRQTLPRLRQPAIEERRIREELGAEPAQSDTASDADTSSVPWYLQVDPPRHPALIHEPTPLPSIPESSPQLLDPLVKFVAEDLGLDQLSLLDLRDLDPPPALGPDLLMLIGTARSERHLHVSADRLVRWLRGRGVSCGADGLLGRNELKIRMRRKARKAKLLGGTGVARDADDGISTGWVCVNLGTIGCSDVEAEVVGEDGRSAGFGAPQTGTTIVVQLLTESRREELQLEKLWSGILRRSRAKTESLQELETATFRGNSRMSLPGPHTKRRSESISAGRRFLSTSTKQEASARSLTENVLARAFSDRSDTNASSISDDALISGNWSRSQFLEQLRLHLRDRPAGDANLILAPGEDGNVSRLGRLLELALKDIPPAEAWSWRVWLKTEMAARNMDSLEDHMASLQELVSTMQQSSFEVTRGQYLCLVKLAFARGADGESVARRQSALAMQVIETMHERGQPVLDHDVIVTVIESLVRARAHGPEAQRVLSVFEHLLAQVDLPCPSPDLLIRLLDVYASQGNWDRFWQVWRIPPRSCTARTPEMYTFLFQRFADDRHQSRCIDALRWAVPEMMCENPPVLPTGPVLEALRACIRVADPRAETIAENVVVKDLSSARLANREFVKMFRNFGVGNH